MGELFGWSLAVGDFNNDGHVDVAVGAPTWSDKNMTNVGRVYVFIGPNENDVFSKKIVLDGEYPYKQFGTIHQYHQQGAIELVTGTSTLSPYISSSTKSMDSYFNRNSVAVSHLPNELFPVWG